MQRWEPGIKLSLAGGAGKGGTRQSTALPRKWFSVRSLYHPLGFGKKPDPGHILGLAFYLHIPPPDSIFLLQQTLGGSL